MAITPSSFHDTTEAVKFLISLLGGAIIAASCSACGVSTGSGFVIGTTDYLTEHNRLQTAKLRTIEKRDVLKTSKAASGPKPASAPTATAWEMELPSFGN